MNFKDQLIKDLDSTFFNNNEFCANHLIDGVEMSIVLDDDLLTERKIRVGKSYDGAYVGEILFHIRKSEYHNTFEDKPAIGQAVEFDNNIYRINDFQENEDMYTITLGANMS